MDNTDHLAFPDARLAYEGQAVVRWHLRGHGNSVSQEDPKPRTHRSFDETDWAKCVGDLAFIVGKSREFVRDDFPDASPPLVLIGEGFGALVALQYAREHGGVDAVVMASPPASQHGIDGEALMKDFEAAPLLFFVSENDATRFASTYTLHELAPEFGEIRVYPGSARGVDLFNDKPGSVDQLLYWLEQVLPKPDAV